MLPDGPRVDQTNPHRSTAWIKEVTLGSIGNDFQGSLRERFCPTIPISLIPPGAFFPLQAHTWSVFTAWGFVSVLHINPFHYWNSQTLDISKSKLIYGVWTPFIVITILNQWIFQLRNFHRSQTTYYVTTSQLHIMYCQCFSTNHSISHPVAQGWFLPLSVLKWIYMLPVNCKSLRVRRYV